MEEIDLDVPIEDIDQVQDRDHGPCVSAHKIVMGNRLLCPRGTKVSVN